MRKKRQVSHERRSKSKFGSEEGRSQPQGLQVEVDCGQPLSLVNAKKGPRLRGSAGTDSDLQSSMTSSMFGKLLLDFTLHLSLLFFFFPQPHHRSYHVARIETVILGASAQF